MKKENAPKTGGFYMDFSWILVVLSLTGNVFVVKKSVIGQWMWALANIGWVTFNLSQGIYSQAFLFAVYFAMCVWGIIAWSKAEAPAKA